MPSSETFHFDFTLGNRVTIDNDPIECVVTAMLCRGDTHRQLECSWMNNGEARSAWIEQWRLTPVGEQTRAGFHV